MSPGGDETPAAGDATQLGGGGGGGGTTATTPSDDPRFDTFESSVVGTVICTKDVPNGIDSTTDPLILGMAWSTSNSTETVLSVDGAAYGTYGPSENSVTLSYTCSGTKTHTYTITASGPGGPDATKTFTATIEEGP